ncbi:MAG: TonB-dependent receptor [Candidatus Krumholzibacteriia bacterium]
MLARARTFLGVAGTVATSIALSLTVPAVGTAGSAAAASPATAGAGLQPPPEAAVLAPPDSVDAALQFYADDVVVTASRYDTDVHLSQTNLTEAQIRLRQTSRDIPMLLEGVPGLFAYSDAGNGIGYTYLNIRGFDQRKVGVLVNGIPLNDPEDQKVYWVNLPDLASSLEDIQVQRGITNSIGGVTAVGGTVNLVTELLDDHPDGRFALETGSFGTSRRTLSYQTGNLGERFATGLRISQIESDGSRDRSGSELWAVFWSGRYQANGHRLTAHVFTGHEVTQHAWWAIDEQRLENDRTFNPETYHNAVDDFRQPQYQVHHEVDLADDVLLRNSVYLIHGEGYYENLVQPSPWDADWAQRYSLDFYLGLADTAQPRLVRQLWVDKDQVGWVPSVAWDHPRGRLVAGGDAYTFQSRHWGDVMWVEGFGTDATIDGLTYHDFTGDKVAWSAFVNERYEVLPRLTLLADLQYQYRRYEFQQNPVGSFRGALLNAYEVEYDFFNPKGGLFWELPGRVGSGSLGVYGHVAVTHQEPSSRDLWDAWQGPEDLGVTPLFATVDTVRGPGGEVRRLEWSDPQVVEERFVNWEAGVVWRGERVSLTVNGYWTEVDDEIVVTGIIDEIGYQERVNAEQTYHRGIELGLRAWLGRRHTLAVALSRSWDRHQKFLHETAEGVAADFSGNRIALFPEYLASASVVSEWGPLVTDVRLRTAGRQHLDNTGSDERTIDPWARLDLGLQWRLGGTQGAGGSTGLTAYLQVFNVLDAEYETWGYYDLFAAVPGNQKLPAAPRHYLAGVRYEF